jgi:predicted RNA-binding Zn-ribbon protein involved in translation (DUF1610 family)
LPVEERCGSVIRFACGSCGAVLRVSDDKAGKRGKCPSCGAVTVVPAASGSQRVGAGLLAEAIGEDLKRIEPQRRCPSCREPVPADAVDCPHCGVSLPAAGPPARPARAAAMPVSPQREKPSEPWPLWRKAVVAIVAVCVAATALVVFGYRKALGLRSLACDKAFSDAPARFRVNFPGKFRVTESSMSIDIASGNLNGRIVQASGQDIFFRVIVFDAKMADLCRESSEPQVVDDLVRAGFKVMGGKPNSLETISRQGQAVRRAAGRGVVAGRKFTVSAELHVLPDRLFLLMVVGPARGTEGLAAVPAFFESFRVTPPPPASQPQPTETPAATAPAGRPA